VHPAASDRQVTDPEEVEMPTIEAARHVRTAAPREPMHVFHGGRSGEVTVEAYADHLEVHAARTVVALWYRHIQGCLPSDVSGREALAIITRDEQVLLVPMAREESGAASWLIEGLRETVDAGCEEPPARRSIVWQL
jgi:hypothetical protein